MTGSITTSYFGKKTQPKGDLIGIVRNLMRHLTSIENHSIFSPSQELLKLYKNNEIEWGTFARKYRNEQKKCIEEDPGIYLALLERSTEEGLILCCYERYENKKNTKCHRILLADILQQLAKDWEIDINFLNEGQSPNDITLDKYL